MLPLAPGVALNVLVPAVSHVLNDGHIGTSHGRRRSGHVSHWSRCHLGEEFWGLTYFGFALMYSINTLCFLILGNPWFVYFWASVEYKHYIFLCRTQTSVHFFANVTDFFFAISWLTRRIHMCVVRFYLGCSYLIALRSSHYGASFSFSAPFSRSEQEMKIQNLGSWSRLDFWPYFGGPKISLEAQFSVSCLWNSILFSTWIHFILPPAEMDPSFLLFFCSFVNVHEIVE